MENNTLIERLDELLPGIRAQREEIERARRLPRELVQRLTRTGLFGLEIPRALGGLEAPFPETMRAIETLATADGSTAWCAALALAGGGAAGFMNETGAKEVFADPNLPTAGVFAPTGAAVRVEGGVRINGRWQFASGINHCDWVWVGCVVMKDGQPNLTPMGPELVHAFMRAGEVEIHDTWFVSGLAGTGSQDISAKDVFVPDNRLFLIGDPRGQRPEPLYRLPPLGAFVSHVAAVSLGIARGALDELAALAQGKVPTFSTVVMADRPVAQVEVARAEGALAAARAFFYETVSDLWRAVRDGAQPTVRQIALNRIAAAGAAEAGAAVTRTVDILAGGSSIYSRSPLQRHMRDAEAILHHFTVAPYVWEDAGRVFLGRKPAAPMF
jgi:alkylation response protein AidB-like acyl-CoA dehydrogenase